MEALTDATLGTGSTIGRYFGVVSVVPSVFLTAWLALVFPWLGSRVFVRENA